MNIVSKFNFNKLKLGLNELNKQIGFELTFLDQY